jgi:3-isopropylmalate/(R)-2-methylmalate dehydratase large subunit
MGQTLAEKILARNAGLSSVQPGELVTCSVDRVMATDITAPLSIQVFREMSATRVFDPDRCILVNDHFVPAKDIQSANLAKEMRAFAKEQGIDAYFEVGRSGICHALVVEKALVLPGELMVGADSHTCTAGVLGAFATGVGSTDLAAAWATGELWFRVPETLRIELSGSFQPFVTSKDAILALVGRLGVDGARYKALEFGGDLVSALSVGSRLVLCNMAVEAGAKAGMVPCDEVTTRYVEGLGKDASRGLQPDRDARYREVISLDASRLEPQVAEPFMPSNIKPVREYRSVAVDQVFIGSCTNGYLEDLRSAAAILRGRRVAESVRLIVTPATQSIYLEAVREGIVADLVEAGAAVTTPTCGACLGGHTGVLGKDEVALATTNRNFRGRMGDTTSRVFLANPAVAAATAVTGRITHPEDLP